ncbi:complement C1q-like protein 2 [Elysia marginata]|uniref:Complement C1q-like protein 2 n=1 Tax=Elysia marginata TaxID=1093978 RepID=A0AAV4GYK5_9GAST|nr:complement C1q-like protein 2 [Elysia marginata]
MRQRAALKSELGGFLSQLKDISDTMEALNRTAHYADETQARSQIGYGRPVTFSAKLSYNRELKPLDTIVFDAIISNVGGGYDAATGKFTAPTDGTYLFYSTILSGYNTKVETAIIMNDKEVARIYSGAHDAHGSGSNTVALSLSSGDVVWVRLLYQGGNHVHGYYSTFTGTLLAEA